MCERVGFGHWLTFMSSILEILDARDPGENLHHLASITALHTLYPECGHVHNDPRLERKVPCAICGTICDCGVSFFSGDELALLETLFESYLSKSSQRVCVLLFCTMMELHLHTFLVNRCRHLGVDWQIIDALLEANSRAEDRLKLFRRLCGCSPDEALAGTSVRSVFTGWRGLQKKRNKVIHGPRGITPDFTLVVNEQDIRLSVELATNSFSAFASLHNMYCSVDAPLLQTPLLI